MNICYHITKMNNINTSIKEENKHRGLFIHRNKIIYNQDCDCYTCMTHYRLKINNIKPIENLNSFDEYEECDCYNCDDTL